MPAGLPAGAAVLALPVLAALALAVLELAPLTPGIGSRMLVSTSLAQGELQYEIIDSNPFLSDFAGLLPGGCL